MFDYYVAIDWAKDNMAVAYAGKDGPTKTFEGPSDVKGLKLLIKGLKGTKSLTIEECNWAQWLYVELKPLVDNLIVCDPYRNKLLCEGAKNDRIDAIKLLHLLKAGLLKPVFHCSGDVIRLRKLISAYDDIVKAGARIKCERDSLYRAQGKNIKSDEIDGKYESFVVDAMNARIALHDEQRQKFRAEFKKLCQTHRLVKLVHSIPGIGFSGAVKATAIIVDPHRFETKGQFLSYCGLVIHKKESGGKIYGHRRPRCNKQLKSVFKTAAAAIFLHKGPFWNYYQKLLSTGIAPHNARNAVARKIAISTLGVLKTQKKFDATKLNAAVDL